jgi:PAS domain S-box-containing protein
MENYSQQNTIHNTTEPITREIDYLQAQIKRLELELARKNGSIESCMENCTSLSSIHDGLLRFIKQDGAMRCIFGNQRIRKMLGYETPDIIGRRLTWFFSQKRDIHRRVDIFIDEKTKGITLETSFQSSIGTPVPVLCSIKQFPKTTNQKNIEYIVIVIDIRALKSAQEQTKSILHAERISTLGHLAAGIAHEINNPLSFLIMDLDRQKGLYEKLVKIQKEIEISESYILSKSDDSSLESKLKQNHRETNEIIKELDEMIQASNDGLKRISEVVKAVKTFGKTDYGNEKNERMKIEDAVDVAIRLISSKIKKANITLEKKFGSTVPIHANMGRLVQVFLNLVLNSIQAIEKEKGFISIKTFMHDEKTVSFEVTDDGNGISPEHMKRIFEPYFTTKPDGTGLGLGIINNIIHELGGKITVNSNVGVGTSFKVFIPVSPKKDNLPVLVKPN